MTRIFPSLAADLSRRFLKEIFLATFRGSLFERSDPQSFYVYSVCRNDFKNQMSCKYQLVISNLAPYVDA